MIGGSKVIVGLDVGSWSVKAVALQLNRDRLSLLGYSQMRVEEQDPSLVVRRVIDQLGIKPRHLVSSVSGRSVIVRQVETPRLGDDELKAHIAYEADKYIPFGADEVVLDCQPLPLADGQETASHQQVLLVAVRRGFVEDHISMLQGAGITPQVIDVDVFALCNAYWVLGPQVGSADTEGATALVDIGASKSWVAIVQGTRPLFQREIYLAGNEITDAIVRVFNEEPEDIENIKTTTEGGEALEALIDAAMPAFEDLANEIRLSFDYVEGQFDEEVRRVVLTGGSALLPSISDILGNILGRPVQVFDPLGGLDLIPSKYDLHGLDANAPALTVPLGLACHLAAGELQGLGGGQVVNWTPRRGGGGGGTGYAAPPPAGSEDTAVTVAAAPPPMQAAASAPPPPPEQPLAFPTPRPDLAPAPPPGYDQEMSVPPPPGDSVPELQPPPAADTLNEMAPPPMELPANEVAPAAPGSGEYGSDQHRSSMLVILDDEDEDQMLDSNERRLDDDEEDEGLPPLPQ